MSSRITSRLVLFFIMISGAVAPYGKAESERSRKTDEQGVKHNASAQVILAGEIPADRLRPLPASAQVITHHAGGSRQAVDGLSGDDSQRLVYGNTLGWRIYPPGNMVRIADDIHTEAIATCELTKYLIGVIGGVADGDGEFDVIVSLFDQCPRTLPWDAPAIPGTEMKFTGLADDLSIVHELVIDYSNPNIGICDDMRACRIDAQDCLDGSACVQGPPVIIPPSVWLRVEFSTNEAGWIVGAPATRGFSADRYDHLYVGCNSWFGGYPEHPHASFYAELYAADSCETHFAAYMAASDTSTPLFDPPAGTLGPFADDIELTVDQCELSVLEIATKGTAGPYEIDFDLRENLQFQAIPGSERTFVSREDGGRGELEIARFTFDPGLYLPRDFWITWQANKPRTGLINAGRTLVGASRPVYAVYYYPTNPGGWTEFLGPDGSPAVFHITVYCRGDEPLGACCPDQPDEPGYPVVCLDGVGALACQGHRWIAGTACPNWQGPDPCWPPGAPCCGTHACCLPDNTCRNLRRDVCTSIIDSEGRASKWFPGEFCDTDGFVCPHFACFNAENDCSVGWELGAWCTTDAECEKMVGPESYCRLPQRICSGIPRGCNDLDCCDRICSDRINRFCCEVAWDELCAAAAGECPPAPAKLSASKPPHKGTLWRSQNNIVRITFDADITAPKPGEVKIAELLQCGIYGSELPTSSFTFDVENDTGGRPRVLKIQENGSVLRHRRWYAFRNVGNWQGVANFELHYLVQAGDCDGDGAVISLDVGCVNAGIPCFTDCGVDNRKDIDGDGRVISLDVGVVNAHIGSFTIPSPCVFDPETSH